jgi:hypothetical protein
MSILSKPGVKYAMDEFNYYFSKYIDTNVTFKQLTKKVIELMDEGLDFEVDIKIVDLNKEDVWQETR